MESKKRAVIAIINYKDKILLGRKNPSSSKAMAGEWHILGETVEGDESDIDALQRCAREEASLERISVGKHLGKILIKLKLKIIFGFNSS